MIVSMANGKIYTKTGDQGMTSLWSGKRIKKSHPRLHVYGTTDELNSHLGLIQSTIKPEPKLTSLSHMLEKVQNSLFLMGSYISCDEEKWLTKLPPLSHQLIEELEAAIDTMQKDLPPLKEFILPNGHPAASQLHIARCICRRAERDFIECKDEIFENATIEMYLNRLSDYLFVAARWVNQQKGISDVTWKK
jgi:cob(I)alamin adenosyltransferase